MVRRLATRTLASCLLPCDTFFPHVRDDIKANVSSDGVLTLRGERGTAADTLNTAGTSKGPKLEADSAPAGDTAVEGKGSATAAGDKSLKRLHSSFSRR